MKDERYFYGFRKIDKIKYTPHALVKPKAQTEREKLIPEISLNTYPIYQYIQLYEK